MNSAIVFDIGFICIGNVSNNIETEEGKSELFYSTVTNLINVGQLVNIVS